VGLVDSKPGTPGGYEAETSKTSGLKVTNLKSDIANVWDESKKTERIIDDLKLFI